MEEPKIKIGFTLTDSLGNEYTSSSFVQVFESVGETPLDVIGQQLNAFLAQAGFSRERCCMLMEDVTEDEMYELTEYLKEIRRGKSCGNYEERGS